MTTKTTGLMTGTERAETGYLPTTNVLVGVKSSLEQHKEVGAVRQEHNQNVSEKSRYIHHEGCAAAVSYHHSR